MQQIEFNVKGTTYKCKRLSDLTLKEYNTLFAKLGESENELTKRINILNILSGMPIDICQEIDINSISQIDFNAILAEGLESKQVNKTYEINNVVYTLQDLNKIQLGRFVDADHFLTTPNSDTDRIRNVVALMLLPPDYTLEEIYSLSESLDTFNILDLLAVFNFFSNYRTSIIKEYSNLFISAPDDDDDIVVLAPHQFNDEPEEPEEEEEDDGWGWQGIIFSLANKNINEVNAIEDKPLILVLNFLSYLKYDNDKELAAIKKQQGSTNL